MGVMGSWLRDDMEVRFEVFKMHGKMKNAKNSSVPPISNIITASNLLYY